MICLMELPKRFGSNRRRWRSKCRL